MCEYGNKIAWIIKIFIKLIEEQFNGTLIFDFKNGSVSKRYKLQNIRYADKIEDII